MNQNYNTVSDHSGYYRNSIKLKTENPNKMSNTIYTQSIALPGISADPLLPEWTREYAIAIGDLRTQSYQNFYFN